MSNQRVEQEMYERRRRAIRASHGIQSQEQQTATKKIVVHKAYNPSELKRAIVISVCAFFATWSSVAGLFIWVAYRVSTHWDPAITFSDTLSEFFGFSMIAGLILACLVTAYLLSSHISRWAYSTNLPFFSSLHYGETSTRRWPKS